MRPSKFLRFWFPVILYSGIIFYVSSIPNVNIPLAGAQIDKILHVLMYIPFGFLSARGFGGTAPSVSGKTLWMLVIVFSLAHGAGDEYHQFFVPGRSADAVDLMSDMVGGTIGGYAYLLFTRKVRNR